MHKTEPKCNNNKRSWPSGLSYNNAHYIDSTVDVGSSPPPAHVLIY